MIQLKVQPLEPVTVSLLYFHFTLEDAAAAGATSNDFADEMDLIVDWTVNKHFTLSLVTAYALPDDGAKQQLGGDNNWAYMMLYGCVKF